MAEGTGRSHNLCVAPPRVGSIVDGPSKVSLHGPTTSEPPHLRRRFDLLAMALCQPIYAYLGLRGFGIKRRAMKCGRKKNETELSHKASNMNEIETRDDKNRR